MVARLPHRDERLREQGRALGDPTRYAVFRYVDEARGPVGVAEITDHFGLNHNAIRQHLGKLRDAGLVVEELSEPSGPGRPSLRYRPTPGAADRWDGTSPYEELSLMLIELVRSGGTPREVGRQAGRRLARRHGPHADPVQVLEAVARKLGFEPRARPRRDGVDIVLDRCPFAASVTVAPEIVCDLHRGLAEGVVETAGGSGKAGGSDGAIGSGAAGAANTSAPTIAVTDLVIRPPRRAGCRIVLTTS